MVRENIKITRYVCVTNKAVCCIWAPIALPIGLKRQIADRERPSVFVPRYFLSFADLSFTGPKIRNEIFSL